MRIVEFDDIGIGAGDFRRLEAAGEVRVFAAAPSADAEIGERLRSADVAHGAGDVAIVNAKIREKATILMVTEGLSDADVEVLGYQRMSDLLSAVDHALENAPQASIGVLPYGWICLPVVA